MSVYLNTVTGEYPRHSGDLELLGWETGQPLPADWVEVEYVEPPEATETTISEQAAPTQGTDGVWRMSWVVRDLTADETTARRLNAIRRKVMLGEFLTPEEAGMLIA